MVKTEKIALPTNGFNDIIDLTERVRRIAQSSGIAEGLVTVFCPGSTGAITAIEAESGVLEDLRRSLEEWAPSNRSYAHDRRWRDGNGFSHIRSALIGPSLSIPYVGGSLMLGTWQQIVFIDFDNRPRQREILVQVLGE